MDSSTESILVGPDVSQNNGTIQIHQTPDSENNSNSEAATPPRSAASTKGFGLKKWRRIPRNNVVKEIENEIADKDRDRDRDSDSDSTAGRMLKRGSSNISTQPAVNDLFAPKFNAGPGPDSSEDRGSSKSSTAPKHTLRQQPKSHSHRGKTVSAKNSTNKPKDDFDKESSPISSFESVSDSRSCNSVFLPPSLDPDTPGPNLDASAQQQPTPDCSDQLSSSVNQGNSKLDYQVTAEPDPLVDSILLLQSAQLALQAEVQKFGEIGKGICSLYDDSNKTSGVAVDAVIQMANGSMCDGCIDNDNLSNSVQTLERQLNEAECNLKDRELRIAKLETTLRNMESSQDHVKSTMEQQYKRCTEMEAELQVLFRQKLEAEILSFVMTRSSKDLGVLVKDHSLLAKEELQSPRTTVDVEKKDGQLEKSGTLYTGEEIREMQRGVNKLTKCFVIQLVLLFVITLFVFRLAPESAVVVPT